MSEPVRSPWRLILVGAVALLAPIGLIFLVWQVAAAIR
jgi:hypothetical protein